MRGPKPSYPIELTSAEAKQLEQLIRAHTTSQSLALRARIILRAYEHPEQSNQQLASTLSTTDRNERVRSWRPTAKRERSCEQAPGWSVSMRKPPFKHGRASSLPFPHAKASRCCTKHAIIVAAHAISLQGSRSPMARSTASAVSAN